MRRQGFDDDVLQQLQVMESEMITIVAEQQKQHDAQD